MTYYAFALNSVLPRYPRGKLQDVDVIAFSVLVNQISRGAAVEHYPIFPGSALPFDDFEFNAITRWTIGPINIEDGDGINVVYAGVNVSDMPDDVVANLEIKLLDKVGPAVANAAVPGSGAVLDFIDDPFGKLLGVTPKGPCNGTVFHDSVFFTGSGLQRLPYRQLRGVGFKGKGDLDYIGCNFTRSYSDEDTHNSDVCGHLAETDVLFTVIKFDYVSVTVWGLQKIRNDDGNLRDGTGPYDLRRTLLPSGGPSQGRWVSVGSLLRL